MEKQTRDPEPANTPGRSRFWWLIGGCVVVLLVAILLPWPQSHTPLATQPGSAPTAATDATTDFRRGVPGRPFARPASSLIAPTGPTAEEIVTRKVAQFARNRRKLMHEMAERLKVKVPARFEEYFDTVEAGKWEDIEAAFKSLSEYKRAALEQAEKKNEATGEIDPEVMAMQKLWRSVSEMDGVVQTAHNWPAQRLLDYGNSILDSLRPGTVYLGGTDPGRFIPTLLNETSEGEHHVVLTQTAFADGTYFEYMRAMYGDRITVPTAEDSQRAFQDYMTDAQRRLKHDQDFPDEPKQIRPGESIQINDNRVQVSGQVAVMQINERLANMFMEKNPGLPFAIEQGMPFDSVYARSTPLGPIVEIGSAASPDKLPAGRAAQVVDYWRTAAQQLNADPTSDDSPYIRDAYAKMASEQGALLLKRDYASEAEQAFRIATEISPANSEAVFRYVNLLNEQQRYADAMRVLDSAMKAAPKNGQFRAVADNLSKQKK